MNNTNFLDTSISYQTKEIIKLKPKNIDDTLTIDWVITRKCNYQCSYCTVFNNNIKFESIDSLKNAVNNIFLLNRKCKITLTGGETTIYPNYKDLLEYILLTLNDNIISIDTITNLSLDTVFYQDLVNRFQNYKTKLNFATSYHFEFADTNKFIQNCLILSNAGFKVTVIIMSHPEQMEFIKSLIKTIDSLSNEHLTYYVATVRENFGPTADKRYSKNDLAWLSTFNQNTLNKKQLLLTYKNEAKNIITEDISYSELIIKNLNDFKGYICDAGINTLSINSDGTLDKAVCFRKLNGEHNIYLKNFSLDVIQKAQPIVCPFNKCSCMANIFIPKYKNEKIQEQILNNDFSDLRNLVDLYLTKHDTVNIENKINKLMTNFYIKKDFFELIYKYFESKYLSDFANKAKNIYFGYKAVEFRDKIKIKPSQILIKEFNELNILFEKSQVKSVFQHYILIHMLLNNIEINKTSKKCEDELLPFLERINWEYKSFLYENTVEKIVKINNTYTKSSVIIISNGNEEYILESLEEIAHQNEAKEYKIIFVSNNYKNQTPKILNLVDTFIQMRENNGAYLARNVGAIFALSDILIFMEDDGIPEKGFVKAHEIIHEDNGIVSLRGCYLTRTNGNMPAHYWLGAKQKSAPTKLEGNCSFKAKEFYNIGGWGDYIMFGHGGLEICHRMLEIISQPEQHVYSPSPVLYHDFIKTGKDIKMKQLTQHASWQMLKFSYDDFHDILKKWK